MTTTGTPERGARRLGSGWSDDSDAALAGREAVELALEGRQASSADLVVLFADVALDPLALVDAAMLAAAPARVVACSGPAAFSSAAGLAACVAIHVPAGPVRFGIGWSDTDGRSLQDATRVAVGAARDEAAHHGDHGTVLLLADADSGDPRDVVRGAYDVTGSMVPLVGGAVGSTALPDRSWIAADGMVLSHGVLAVWIASGAPLGVAFDHGWQPVGPPMQVTRAADGRILELDGRPAELAYLDAREAVDPALLELAIPGMELPLGLPGDDGYYEVCAFVSSGPDGLVLNGTVHEQAIVRIMAARHDQLVGSAGAAVRAARAQLGRPATGALVFSCNTRYDLLQDAVVDEVAAVTDALDGVAAIGFFTHGEFAKIPGAQGFHTASVAVLAL